jgi:hypothetical protein
MKIKTTPLIMLVSVCFCLRAQNSGEAKSYSGDLGSGQLITGELKEFDFNTKGKTEAYPSLTSDGMGLYYTNNQTKNWIFYTHRDAISAKWQVPVPIVIEGFDTCILSCCFIDNSRTLYFTTGRGVYASRALEGSFSRFGEARKIHIINRNSGDEVMAPFSYLSFSSDMTLMYAYIGNSRDVSMASYRLFGENTYEFNEVITASNKEMGRISGDGLVYYFTNDENPNVLYCKRRSSPDWAFGPAVFTVKEFRDNIDIGQVSIAEKAGVLALVVSKDLWEKNDLYLLDIDGTVPKIISSPQYWSYKPSSSSVETAVVPPVENISGAVEENIAGPVETITQINAGSGAGIYKVEIGKAYPNPAKNLFYFYYSVESDKDRSKQATAVVMDNTGREVYSRKLDNLKGEARIELENVAPGTYFIRIDYNGTSSAMSKVVIMNN